MLVSETEGRFARKRKRNYASAHFPPGVKPIDEFDPSELESGITAGQVERLKELDWLDSHGNVALAGPPGPGKTMIALGLGLLAYGFFRLFPAIGERGAIVSLAELLLIFLYLAVASWVFPTLSRFTMGVGALCSACVRLAPGYAPRSAAMALMQMLAIAASLRFVVPAMFAPALLAWLSSFLLEPVFARYETPDA